MILEGCKFLFPCRFTEDVHFNKEDITHVNVRSLKFHTVSATRRYSFHGNLRIMVSMKLAVYHKPCLLPPNYPMIKVL